MADERAHHRYLSSHEPHFNLVHRPAQHAPLAGASLPTEASLHHGMVSEHAFEGVAPIAHHEQSSDTMSAVHTVTPEQFIAQQQAQSQRWVKQYAKHLNGDVAFPAHFVFGRTTPLADPLSRSDTALAILNEFGQ
jgi:hypothetical protein